MRKSTRPFERLYWLTLVCAALFAACGGNSGGKPATGGAGGAGGSSPSFTIDTGSTNPGGALTVTPANLAPLTLGSGKPTPTVTLTATLDGKPAKVAWSVDAGVVGTISPSVGSTAVFTPSGGAAGIVTITARITSGGKTYTTSRRVQVNLQLSQKGPNNSPAEQAQIAPTDVTKLNLGGGVGGVGGEGLGPAVTDTATLTAFTAPTSNGTAQSLALLYPYDRTVWPRGLLAPLLMWDWSMHDADAVQITLNNASGTFSWTGIFGRPAILASEPATGGKFVRHPIPQDVWDQATNSAGGTLPTGGADTLTLGLTVAKGGKAYGPITQTWIIVPAHLSGTIYYQSYGTFLAKNATDGLGGDHVFGAAVLSIRVGDTSPKIVSSKTDCQVCHSVAAGGSRLIVDNDQPGRTTASAYDLTPTATTQEASALTIPVATYQALYPDGSKALLSDGTLWALPYTGAPTNVTGAGALPQDLGAPAFSPDGKLLAFNASTAVMSVVPFDPLTNAFSTPRVVASYTDANTELGWPAFFPTSQALVFERQTAAGSDGDGPGALLTRAGAKGQIVWTSAKDATHVAVLNQLNGLDGAGKSYLPTLATAVPLSCTADSKVVDTINPKHDDDVHMNYEPTVNPVVSGGYAWVVFTSRRLYGNEATIPPYCSDPRGVDLQTNITTKKLWVAAIDANGNVGTDASHPAFYLPGQELLAGNARGFWVLDPCRADGQSCATGDQCCNGYCEPSGDGGALVCSNTNVSGSCSQYNEKCTATSDCCDAANAACIGGFCVQDIPVH